MRALREAMQNERHTVIYLPYYHDTYDHGYTFYVCVNFDTDNCPAEILAMMSVDSDSDDL